MSALFCYIHIKWKKETLRTLVVNYSKTFSSILKKKYSRQCQAGVLQEIKAGMANHGLKLSCCASPE